MSAPPEAFIPLNGSAGNSAPVTGGRRHSKKHLKLVTRKQARSLLKKMGKKMRGGDANAPGGVVVDDTTKKGDGAMGGRRKSRRKTHRRGRKLFGLPY